MKKLISILVVCLLIAALSPAVFADDGHDCTYGIHYSNGDGTHTTYCSFSYWHRYIEDCWSDNNENGRCDHCAQEFPHDHLAAEEWSFDAEAHWHACTNEYCEAESVEELKGYAAHELGEDGVCTVCGYADETVEVAEETAEVVEEAAEVVEETAEVVEEATEETAE